MVSKLFKIIGVYPRPLAVRLNDFMASIFSCAGYRGWYPIVLPVLVIWHLEILAAPLEAIVPGYMGDGLELAITPAPQKAGWSDEMLEIGTVQVLLPPGDYGAPPTLEAQALTLLGESRGRIPVRVLVGDAKRNPEAAKVISQLRLPAAMDGRGDEAYQLYTGADPAVEGGNLILLAGNSPQGDFWALQSLAQIMAAKDGVKYVRKGAVSDWPLFPKRGNKRPKIWEYRFKANYAWSSRGAEKEFRDVFRTRGAWVYHVAAIDLSNPEWLPGVEASARQAYERGVREFVIKYDDAPRAMTPATREAFKGNYFAAQVKFLSTLFRTFKAWNEDNDVFFMPQPYWTHALDIIEYGECLQKEGGLPPGMGLSFCGQEVISASIPNGCVLKAQETLGLTGHKAQIYDNDPRGGDFSAYRGRDPGLWKSVECIFPERGTPVTRITVYDYLWNPEAYDPARSLKLACRELAGRDPAVYQSLYDYVSTWNRERDAASFLTRSEARKQLAESIVELRRKYDGLRPLLEKNPLAKEAGLAESFLHGENWGESAALLEREQFNSTMIEHGYKEGIVRRTRQPIAIDGNLEDGAWKDADRLHAFVLYRQTGPSKQHPHPEAPLAAAPDQTEVRVLYDDENLYVGVLMRHSKPPEFPKETTQTSPGAGQRGNLAWRLPCIEICLDPERDRESYFQIMTNLQGWYSESHHAGFGSELGSGPWWSSEIRFSVAVSAAHSVVEAAIPLKNLGRKPRPGDRWGAQFCRNLNGLSTWSAMYEFFGFRHPRHFGTLIFEGP